MDTRRLDSLRLEEFPLQTYDKIRYRDTDRQGHVNNVLFSTFLETGRVELLYNPDAPLADDNCSFVIANVHLNLLSEIQWPGIVNIGTGISRIGTSSIHVRQSLFQDGKPVATAESVVVQINEESRHSTPLSETTKAVLAKYQLPSLAPGGSPPST